MRSFFIATGFLLALSACKKEKEIVTPKPNNPAKEMQVLESDSFDWVWPKAVRYL
jgi:hypothetical protein